MRTKLPTWCKVAKIKRIIDDCDIDALAEATGYTRQYTSAVLNGKAAADSAVNRISEVLGISNDYDGSSLLSLIPIIRAAEEKRNG